MKYLKYIVVTILILASFYLGIKTDQKLLKHNTDKIITEKTDTLYITDTIHSVKPVYRTKRITDSIYIAVTDTVRLRDTLFINLPKEQIIWKDSLSTVYASGIYPQVDSVTHYLQNTIIYKEHTVYKTKKTHWGIGINAGYGATVSNKQILLSPYIGVGVSYNIYSW